VNSLGKVTYIGDSLDNRPVVLVYAQKLYTGYLDHVLAVFNRIGYLRVESAVLTSIDPLRVYVYEDEILIRCCIQDYHPLDVTNEKQYVVGDEYTQPWELDSLRYKWKRGKFSRKQMLFTHLTENGKDADKVWLDIKNAIKEVNMSPNLSSGSHIDNAVLYEQVIFNLFGLVGVANKLGHGTRLSAAKEREMQVTDMDIMTSFDACATRECRNSCSQEICELCHPCLTEDQKVTLKLARLEHVNRGGFRRVVPPPMSQSEARVAKSSNDVNGSNRFMWIWFRRMCLRDPTWCH
ncbi:predicted protein, partial [Nematostella vectensis]